MHIDRLKRWIGRSEQAHDRADEAPLARLAVLLDHAPSAPLFDTAPFALSMARHGNTIDLWSTGPDGNPAMTAILETGE